MKINFRIAYTDSQIKGLNIIDQKIYTPSNFLQIVVHFGSNQNHGKKKITKGVNFLYLN
jgi:hypothetical protein